MEMTWHSPELLSRKKRVISHDVTSHPRFGIIPKINFILDTITNNIFFFGPWITNASLGVRRLKRIDVVNERWLGSDFKVPDHRIALFEHKKYNQGNENH